MNVITLTQTPATAPIATASATSPSSPPRRRDRNAARAAAAPRGEKIMVAAVIGNGLRASATLCVGSRPKPSCASSPACERHVVAMDHFGAARRAEDLGDVARLAAANALRMRRVVGDEPAADLGPAFVADRDAVAARKDALDPGDAGGQQAFAVGKRRGRAGVDEARRP